MQASANAMSNLGAISVTRACQSTVKILALAALLFVTGLTGVCAQSDQIKLVVSASISKHASLKVLTQPAAVVVTAADITRGYVDVPAPASVQVQTNTQNGYLLTFDNQGEFMRSILVKGLANDVQIGLAGGGVAHNTAGQGMRRAQLDLGFRFILASSAQEGVYPWPVRLSVTPL